MYDQAFMDKVEKLISEEDIIKNYNVYSTVTKGMDLLIAKMLYSEVQKILNHIYGKDGIYDSRILRKKEWSEDNRSIVRNIIKNDFDSIMRKEAGRYGAVKDCQVMRVMRKMMEWTRNLSEEIFRKYYDVNFRLIYHGLSYYYPMNANSPLPQYKSYRNSDILKFKLLV